MTRKPSLRLTAMALLALAVSAPAAHATTLLPAACPASAAAIGKLDKPLPKLAAALAGDGPVTIVAIGSSSTAGAGASSPAAAYPARLEAALRERYPGRDITVINRGVNGQDGPEMLARFTTDVEASKPTLVLWQGGVNALFRDDGLATAGAILHDAIQRTRALGADMVIIDPQYAPRVVADADAGPMVSLINAVGEGEGVPVFHRFALMRDWHERGGVPFDSFLWKDKFHMNDWSYDCLSRDLARALTANVEAQQRSADAFGATTAAKAGTSAKPPGTPAPALPAAGTGTLAN
ncbi:SGNH/GDSL hydrolase family protein [Ancylobacter lacus]|uniref:SGNH/GDSL hydrolase family protein n=1 Tax=Ancylobacter lacus TaxID=2579970 RepID=UPI001FE7CF86|nr:SGNH/GDSL hydrolase family protein [Ancylobacter lacus]